MPFCSSGITQPRPGVADDVILSAAVISSLLPAGAVWLEPFIGAAAGIFTLHLPSLCGSDPPPDPGLTAADVLALATLGPGPLTQGPTDRFNQLITRWAWPVFCECASVGTPSLGTFPTAPAGLPTYNPPGLVGLPAAPCASESYAQPIPLATGTRYDVISRTFCDGVGQPTCVSLRRPLPAPVVAYDYTATNRLAGFIDPNTAHFWNIFLAIYDVSGVPVTLTGGTFTQDFGPRSGAMNAGFTQRGVGIPSNAVSYQIYAQTNTALTWDGTAAVTWYCTTGDASPIQPCCTGSDPFITGQLNSILQLLTIVQRNLAPFAYVPGASHAGLTGNGTLTIPSCIGVLITMTTIPGWIGSETGAPLEYFEAGWFSWGNPSGYTAREWISHSPQLSFPATAEQYTRLGYSLKPGVIATIQELYAET